MDILGIITGRILLNYIGGTLQYIYGSVWRTLFNKPKFTFKEYINGPNKKDYYDEMGHELNNRIIASIFIVVILLILID